MPSFRFGIRAAHFTSFDQAERQQRGAHERNRHGGNGADDNSRRQKIEQQSRTEGRGHGFGRFFAGKLFGLAHQTVDAGFRVFYGSGLGRLIGVHNGKP